MGRAGGCCVPTCKGRQPTKSGKYAKIKLHRFPQDVRRRIQWANLIKRQNWVPNDNSRICERHFENDQFFIHYGANSNNRVLHKNAIPTIFPHQHPEDVSKYNEMINVGRNVESTVNDHDYLAPKEKWKRMEKRVKPKIEYSANYPVIIDDSEMSCNIFQIKVQNKPNISEEENKNKDDLIELLKQQQRENIRKIRNLSLENKTMFTLLEEKNKLLEEKDKVIEKVKEENRLFKKDPQKKLCQCIVYSGLTDE